MERMSTLDAGFFFAERQNVPMHVGLLALFEGPVPAYDDLVLLIAAKLPLAPQYRQVVRAVPLQAFRPFWVDDEHFEITYHVRHAAVPAPGGTEQLRTLAARIFAHRLDRARPLWEDWLLEGLEGDRWAILSKVHHCMVDGIGATDLMTVMFELGPDTQSATPVPWKPRPAPSAISLVTSGLLSNITGPLSELAAAPAVIARRLRTPRELLGFGGGLASGARRLTARSVSSLNGPIGPHRRWTSTTASLNEVKEIRRATGSTVNDVLLAAITRGFRDLLETRGELADGLVVRSLVPVSVRAEAEHGAMTNRVSSVLVNLPVSERDPLHRLALVHGQMDAIKRTHQAVGAEFLTEMLGPLLLGNHRRSGCRARSRCADRGDRPRCHRAQGAFDRRHACPRLMDPLTMTVVEIAAQGREAIPARYPCRADQPREGDPDD